MKMESDLVGNTSYVRPIISRGEPHHLAYLYITVMALFIIVMFILLYLTRQRVKKKISVQELDPNYIAIRKKLEQLLQPYLYRIESLTQEIICSGLLTRRNLRMRKNGDDVSFEMGRLRDRGDRKEAEGREEDTQGERKLPEQVLADLLLSVMESSQHFNINQKQLCGRAMRAILKTYLITNPYDLRGSRRCYVAEKVLVAVLKEQPVPRLSSSQFSQNIRFDWMLYVKVLSYVVFISFGLWAYDIYTDVKVGVIFLELMCELDLEGRFCPTVIREWLFNGVDTLRGDQSGDGNFTFRYNTTLTTENAEYLVSVLGIHNINFVIFFVASIVLSVLGNPFKKLTRLVQTKLSMSLSANERSGIVIPPEHILSRYRLSIDEAGFESVLCNALSIGNYLNLVYMTNQMPEIHDEELNSIVNSWAILISFFVSVLSLTNAQVKSHDTQHEYSMSLTQKLTYILACTANTISFSLLFCGFYSICMFWCCNMYFKHKPTSPLYILGFFMNGVVCVLFAGLIRVTVTFISGIIYHQELQQMEVTDTPLNVSKVGKILNSAETFQLPTSNTHLSSYNSIDSVKILIKFSNQCLSYIILSGQGLVQFLVIWLYNGFDINKSQEWEICIRLAVVCIPAGYILSYFFLWLYFKLDEGHFTSVNLQFVYTNGDEVFPTEKEKTPDIFVKSCKEYVTNLSFDQAEECQVCNFTMRRDLACSRLKGCGTKKVFDTRGHWKEFPM